MTVESSAKKIVDTCDSVKSMLLEKNAAYGDSVLNPIRVFSKASREEQARVRLDDKLSRIARGTEIAGEDALRDAVGYMILLLCMQSEDGAHDVANKPAVGLSNQVDAAGVIHHFCQTCQVDAELCKQREETAKWHTKAAELEVGNETWKKACADARDACAMFQDSNASLEGKLRSLEDVNARQAEKIGKLQYINFENWMLDKKKLEDRLGVMNNECKNHKETIAIRDRELSLADIEVAKTRAALEQAKKKIEVIYGELAESKATVNRLNAMCSEDTNQIKTVQAELDRLRGERDEWSSKARKTSEENQALGARIDVEIEAAKKAWAELADAKASINLLNAARVNDTNILQSKDEKIAQLQDEVRECREECSMWRESAETAIETKQELERTANEQVARANAEVVRLRNINENLLDVAGVIKRFATLVSTRAIEAVEQARDGVRSMADWCDPCCPLLEETATPGGG